MKSILPTTNRSVCLIFSTEEPKVFAIYEKEEQKCRKITNSIANSFLRLYTFGTVLPITLHPIWCMLRGNFDTSTWYFPLSIDIPYDISTIHGWYLRTFFHLFIGYAYFLTLIAIVPFFACGCIYVQACCKHFQLIFDECDELIKAKCDDKASKMKIFSEKIKSAVLLHMKITKYEYKFSQDPTVSILLLKFLQQNS